MVNNSVLPVLKVLTNKQIEQITIQDNELWQKNRTYNHSEQWIMTKESNI